MLRVSNKHMEDTVKTLQEHVHALSTSSLSSAAGGMQRQEDKDHIRMLEAQVQIFTEDFEQERKDRERAQAKCAELEQELELVKRQVQRLLCKQIEKKKACMYRPLKPTIPVSPNSVSAPVGGGGWVLK